MHASLPKECDSDLSLDQRRDILGEGFSPDRAECASATGQGKEILRALRQALKGELPFGKEFHGDHALHELLLLCRCTRVDADDDTIGTVLPYLVAFFIKQVTG